MGPWSAWAVQVLGTTGNITAPPSAGNDPGFANVGSLNTATAVYLGDGWVLTASHVGTGTVFLGGTGYAAVDSGTILSNPSGMGMQPLSDLRVFRIIGDPGLPSLSISPAAPMLGDPVVMIGNGDDRISSRTTYSVLQGPGAGDDAWDAPPVSGRPTEDLFLPAGGQSIRWGTNNAEAVNFNANILLGPFDLRTVRSFLTLFDDDLIGRPNEAQAVRGDSGSAAFRKVSGNWELSGITYAVSTDSGYDNVPFFPSSSVIGDSTTFIGDLSFYRSQILSIIPEPGSAALFSLALFGLLRRRRA